MAIVANPLVENINPDFAIIGTPYVYDSIEHQLRILLSGDMDELFATTQAAGFYVLAAYNLGPRNVYLRDGIINTPEDLAGKAIRVMQSDTMVQMMNLMGAVGTPMGQGDVYTAIQTGVLAGAENNIITYLDLVQFEVAPYYIQTGHLMIPDLVIINNSVLNNLSADDQAALRRLARESIGYMFAAAEALREDYRNRLLAHGVTFHTVDIASFQARLADFIQQVADRSEKSQRVFQIIQSHR
jgi:TRAP-type C4-dicarboxylate transport system substrate-binding protein